MDRIRRAARWFLAAIAGLFAFFGAGDVVGGAAFEPTGSVSLTGKTLEALGAESPDALRVIDANARSGGLVLLSLGVLLLVILAVPYRRGERWAWWAMWLLPAWIVSSLVLGLTRGYAPGQGPSAAALSGVVFAVLAALALFVDAPRFRER